MKNKFFYLLTISIWVIYVILSLNAPAPASNPYNLSAHTTFILRWTIFVPLLLIWITAVYGAVNLYQYATLVKHTKDGGGMYPMSLGINLIVLHLFLSSLIGVIRSYLINQPAAIEYLTVLSNALYVIFYLAAFMLLYYGSKKLLGSYKESTPSINLIAIAFFILMIVMYFYLESIFNNPNRLMGSGPGINASYFLPDSLIVLTIIIPSFVTWVAGILTIGNLNSVGYKAIGVIYKKTISNLTYGVFFVITCSIFIQGITSVGSARLLQIGFSGILILIYLLLVFMALGFVLIARGSRKLSQIESI